MRSFWDLQKGWDHHIPQRLRHAEIKFSLVSGEENVYMLWPIKKNNQIIVQFWKTEQESASLLVRTWFCSEAIQLASNSFSHEAIFICCCDKLWWRMHTLRGHWLETVVGCETYCRVHIVYFTAIVLTCGACNKLVKHVSSFYGRTRTNKFEVNIV